MEVIQDFRSLGPEAQTQIRVRAVEAVRAGNPQVLVASVFKVTVVSVCRWVSRACEGGMEALLPKPRGAHKHAAILSDEEQEWMAEAIRDKTPRDFGLSYPMWSRAAVAALAKSQFGKDMCDRTAGRYLARWHYTPKKPVRNPYEKNAEEKERFLHHRFPAIARSAREHNAVLVWPDECGFRSTDSRGRAYSPIGIAPKEDASAKRFGCNVISAVTPEGRAVAMEFTGSFTSQVFIAFMEILISRFRRMVYLIMDSHPVHVSEEVQDWLHEHRDRIRTFLLPGECPELNPQELMNNDAKAQVAAAKRPHNLSELVSTVCSAIKSIIESPSKVRAYFRHVQVIYILG